MTGDERTVDVFRVPPPGHTSVPKFPVPVNDDVGVFTTYIVVTIMSGSTSSPYPFEVKGKSTVPRDGREIVPTVATRGHPLPKRDNR